MYLKKLLPIFILLSSFAFAQPSKIQMLEAIKSNPALLNTPQAQAQMAKKGVTKEQVLQKVNQKSTTKTIETIEKKAENKIDKNTKEKVTEKEIVNENKIIINTFSDTLNPLKYKNNNELLAQIKSKQSIPTKSNLKRFGLNFFKNKNSLNSANLPVPDFYILNINDTLSVWIYGAKNNNFELTVDNKGNINIPKLGPIYVKGLEFKNAKKAIKSKLKPSFKNSEIVINISKISTMQVTLTGAVEAPGIYNISSMSTIKDLLIASNGVKENGSLRTIQIKRAGKIYKIVDFYKLIKEGDDALNLLLKSNDIIFVPQAKTLVKLDGEINTKAIFELKDGESLADIFRYAGGLKATSSKYNIKIQRYINNEKTKFFEVDYKDAEQWSLKDGDSIYVHGIDKVHTENIFIYGNVVRPGKIALNNERSLQKVFLSKIQKVGIKGMFLDNTLLSYGLIKRSNNKLLISFNLQDILDKKSDIALQKDDEIYIFNKFDTALNPFVTIKGSVVAKKGKYQFIQGITVSDLIKIAGTLSPYDTTKIKITTYDENDMMPVIVLIDESEALNYKLKPFDEVELYDYYLSNNLKYVNIKGNVHFTGKFILGKDMKIREFLSTVGGLKPYTFTDYLRVERTMVVNGKNGKEFQVENIYLNIDKIMQNTEDNILLKDKDNIEVYSIEDMSERKKVTISGEIKNPNDYFIGDNTTIKDIIKAAGGLTNKAYTETCEVVRYIIKNNIRTTKIYQVDFTDTEHPFILKEFDEIRINRIPNWHDKKTITLKGEIKFPGTYVFKTGDKLADVIQRAGGYTTNAFLRGAIFTRDSIKKMQRERMKENILKLKQEALTLSTQPSEVGEGDKSKKIDIQGLINIIDSLAKEYEKLQPMGRITIKLDQDLINFKQTSSNLVLEDKDTLLIPSKNDTVLVMGEVMSQTAIIFESTNVKDYINDAGGLTQRADEDRIYIVHADGSASKVSSSWFSNTEGTIKTGDVIVVPKELVTYSGLQIAKDISSILYQFALTAASLHVVGAI